MKIVSAQQPYFAPYAGFFQKALRSDILVLMDSVQFPQGTTWLTRNRFKNDQGTLWITIPVWKKGRGLQKISEVEICHEGRWAKKDFLSLTTAYANAPYFRDHVPFLEDLFSGKDQRLVDLNIRIIRYVMNQLHIKTKLVCLSELGICLKEPRLSIEISKLLGATHFLAQNSACKYLDQEGFQNEGIELIFFNPRPPVYPQLWGEFLPNLSCLDLLFNCGPRSTEVIRKGIRTVRP
ncbi:MAG: hypothetical protein DRG71_06170 [Deltaproteobacteria bacterium]|nr:MAG: hypothetical protein DRG71_06170 [Deltaproteobacteria bacterium]